MARILIIDDDARVLEVLVAMVRAVGHDALGANSGPLGLTLIEQTPPDLVIVDLRMSELSGAEVLDQVRRRHRDLPVLVLTGNLDPQVETDVRRRGASGFVVKPVLLPELRRQIETALSGRG